jgi:hypothetical protein
MTTPQAEPLTLALDLAPVPVPLPVPTSDTGSRRRGERPPRPQGKVFKNRTEWLCDGWDMHPVFASCKRLARYRLEYVHHTPRGDEAVARSFCVEHLALGLDWYDQDAAMARRPAMGYSAGPLKLVAIDYQLDKRAALHWNRRYLVFEREVAREETAARLF